MNMHEKDESIKPVTTSGSECKYTFVLRHSRDPPTLPPAQEKHSSIILPACRENFIPLQSSPVASQSVVVKPNHVVTVGKNMTSSEVCLIELQSAGIRTEQNSSVLASQSLMAGSDFSKTSQQNSVDQISTIAPVVKKSNIILPASRESLVPLQPPQTLFKPPVRTSHAFPTAPKVMVRKFNLSYNSQTNTHLQNKLLSKVRILDEEYKIPTSITVSSVVSKGDFLYTVNSELCNSGSKVQLTKVNSSELNSILSRVEQPSMAVGSSSTVAVVSPTYSSQKTSACVPVSAVPLKLVPTILKRSPAKTVVTPSGSGTTGSIPSTGPSTGPRTSVPVIIMNNKGATVTTAVNKPIVSLAGKSVITKDNKIFNIKIVDGKCVLYENVDSKSTAVSEVSNQPKVIKQADLKMFRTPKFIKVDSRASGYILKRCIQNSEDARVAVSKQLHVNVISEKMPQPSEHMDKPEQNTTAPLEATRGELIMHETSTNPVGSETVPSNISVSYDPISDGLDWDANEILKTLDGEHTETRHNLVNSDEQVKQIKEVQCVREVELPARKIHVVDAWSQTDRYSPFEIISPAAKYGSGSVLKKQTVTATSAPVAVVERIPPVHSVAPCVQEAQPEAKRAKLDVGETEGCLSSSQNKSNDGLTTCVQNTTLNSHAHKEIEPVVNTAVNFDSATLWHDLLKNCSATEIEPDQLLMLETGTSDANVRNGYRDKSSVHDLIVKHNIDKLCNKNKLIKNDGPCGGEYYKPISRKRKQTFPSSTNQKLENCVKKTEANISAQYMKPPNVNGSAVLEDPKLKLLLDDRRLLQKLYYEWINSVNPDLEGNIELHYAVTEENVNLVRRQCMVICARKLSVDLKNNERETALHLAVRNGHKQITQILLSYDADPCVKNSKGNTALHLAVLADSVGSLRALLARDSTWALPLDVLNDEGLAPLHLCAMNNKNKQLLELLAAGANVNLEDGKSGRTALFHAVEADNNQIVRILLAAGADSSLQNFSGHTPLHAASEVSVTDKRVMSELITNEGISSSASVKLKKKPGLKSIKNTDYSDDEDDPKCVRNRRKSVDNKC